MPKGIPNKLYTPEFKVTVVETMQKEELSYSEAARQFAVSNHHRVASWERAGQQSIMQEKRRSLAGLIASGQQAPGAIRAEMERLGFYLTESMMRNFTAGRIYVEGQGGVP